MTILSGEFLFLLLIATLVLYFKLRKNKVSTYVPRKSISIRGQRVICDISKETPLLCLLHDNQTYGEDFNLKELPNLPHQEGCNCQIVDLYLNSSDIFKPGKKGQELRKSDLGPLPPAEFRYYKYALIVSHPEASSAQKQEYLDLLSQIPVSDRFKAEVLKHLNIHSLTIEEVKCQSC